MQVPNEMSTLCEISINLNVIRSYIRPAGTQAHQRRRRFQPHGAEQTLQNSPAIGSILSKLICFSTSPRATALWAVRSRPRHPSCYHVLGSLLVQTVSFYPILRHMLLAFHIQSFIRLFYGKILCFFGSKLITEFWASFLQRRETRLAPRKTRSATYQLPQGPSSGHDSPVSHWPIFKVAVGCALCLPKSTPQ